MIEYPIAETFNSLKGEGMHTGQAMHFIRFSGCNLKCSFCDTEHDFRRRTVSLEALVDETMKSGLLDIVLTGGEPCLQNLEPLIFELHKIGGYMHIETNGTLPLPTNLRASDWVTLSPKNEECCEPTVLRANEIKFLCGGPIWKKLIEYIERDFPAAHGQKLLMPIARGKYDKGWNRTRYDLIDENVKMAVEYCLKRPEFRFCIQEHKILNIP